MNSLLRLPCAILMGATLLATPAAVAQLNDGRPDPGFAVPAGLDLEYALAFALDNNFAIRQAKERIRQQEGILVEIRSSQSPAVTAGGGLQANDKEIGSTGGDNSWSLNVTARQIVYSGGAVGANVRSQQLALDAAALSLQAVINDALLDVRTRFYTVLVNRERIKVQEQNIELLRRQLQDVRNRFEAGTVSNFEVLRAEVAVANAQPALITARNDYRVGIDELRRSLGFVTTNEADVTRIPEFIGTLEFAPNSFDLRSAIATARERRPDLQRLRKLEQAAVETVEARRAGNRPNLSLFGAYDWRRAPVTSPDSVRDGWTVGVQSTWNIFDSRATAGRVAQARSLLEQTRLTVEEAQLSADVAVRRAISTFQQSTELAEASKRVVEQAEEAVRLANARYSAGTATQLDVLTSQVDLTTARLNQLQAYYSYNVSIATVRNAMGLADEQLPTRELVYPAK